MAGGNSLQTKIEIRQKMLEKRVSLSPQDVHEPGQIIQKKVIKNYLSTAPAKIGLYSAVKNEVETHLLLMTALEKGWSVYFPRVEQGIGFYEITDLTDLVRGAWSIMEPRHECKPLGEGEKLDLLITPGIAFDKRGYRIGYGRGLYDRVIDAHRGQVVGLGYHFQVLEELPNDPWDKKVDWILTEKDDFGPFSPS